MTLIDEAAGVWVVSSAIVQEKMKTHLEVASRHADEHEGALTRLDLPPQEVVQQPASWGRGPIQSQRE